MSVATSTAEKPITRIVDLLQRKGYNPQPCGPGQWKSQCPAHKGKSANLSLKEGLDGSALLNCHHVGESGRTCTAAAICDELGLTLRDLFPQRAKPSRPPRSGRAKPFPSAEAIVNWIAKRQGNPTAMWVYQELHDGQRFELMRVYRFDTPDGKKDFRPIHPSAEGWFIGDPPGKLPLFHLPEVSTSDSVVVVGEVLRAGPDARHDGDHIRPRGEVAGPHRLEATRRQTGVYHPRP
jgi:putative DNA primase/helicase